MKKNETKVELDRVENEVKKHDYVNPKMIAKIIGVHYYTARNYLIKLEERGVLERLNITTKVHDRYLYKVLNKQQTLDIDNEEPDGQAEVAGLPDTGGDTKDKGEQNTPIRTKVQTSARD